MTKANPTMLPISGRGEIARCELSYTTDIRMIICPGALEGMRRNDPARRF